MFSKVGKKTDMPAALLHRRRRARRGRRRARRARLRPQVLHRRGQLGHGGQQHAGLLHPRSLQVPRLHPHPEARSRRPTCASNTAMWDFWSLSPESLHQVTILFSDRGLPQGYRHMNGYGSHTYSFINAKNERFWVKFHFKTKQGIKTWTERGRREASSARTAKAHSAICSRPSSAATSPSGRSTCRSCPKTEAETYRINPFDLTKVWPHARLSADRGRRDGAEPQPGELLRRGRAGRLLAGQRRARHRLLAGQDAPGAHRLLRRRAPLPPRRELRRAAGQPAACPRSTPITATAPCASTATPAARSTTSPTASAARWRIPRYKEPPLKISGDADRYDHSRRQRRLHPARQPVPADERRPERAAVQQPGRSDAGRSRTDQGAPAGAFLQGRSRPTAVGVAHKLGLDMERFAPWADLPLAELFWKTSEEGYA